MAYVIELNYGKLVKINPVYHNGLYKTFSDSLDDTQGDKLNEVYLHDSWKTSNLKENTHIAQK